MRSWHIQIKNDKSLADISQMFNAVLRGWSQYYGRFYSSALVPLWKHFNWYLAQSVRRKYKRFAGHKRRAFKYLNTLSSVNTHLFIHWQLGIIPGSKVVGAG
jgi:RNA-directed DNA polymerase